MITILYDTASELDNFKEFFIDNCFGCCDFSDVMNPFEGTCDGNCKACRQRFIDTNIQDRAEYQKLNPFLKNQPESCNTCANAPICWLATTAAAPAPCRHYIPEVYKHEGK